MEAIVNLLHYAIQAKLIAALDYDYAFNRLTRSLDIDIDYQPYNPNKAVDKDIDTILKPLLDHAVKIKKISPDTTQMRDVFESEIMDIVTPNPANVQARFEALKEKDSVAATDDFYQRSQKSNYIKMNRIRKNTFYKVSSNYGDIEITINRSKPEKDPKDIAKKKIETNYPECLLCKENVGYHGHANHPGRSHHRIIKLSLNHDVFYFQFSPYVYYNEHAIVLHEDHIPMNLGKHTFKRLFDFVDEFPHYFLGSNAGLPIVGGSILSHEHYQGGRARFPIDDAKSFYSIKKESITYELLNWPLSVIRMRGKHREELIEAAEAMRIYFAAYSDESLDLRSKSTDMHNAITPILRKNQDTYQLTIALRNNRTSDTYPDGIFHPHPARHHIKKENIGLIEVMGLAILPGRLHTAFNHIEAILKGTQDTFVGITPYREWIETLKTKMPVDNIRNLIEQSAGEIFIQGLEDCGIFKQTPKHRDKFKQFLEGYLSWHLKS